MGRSDFLLDLIRTRNGVAIAALVALVIVGRVLGNRRSTLRRRARSGLSATVLHHNRLLTRKRCCPATATIP